MKLTGKDFVNIARISMVWLLLNIFLNIAGLFISKTFGEESFTFFNSILSEFSRPLFYQFLSFVAITIVAEWLLSKFKLRNYLFPALQFVVFNLIFLFGLKFSGGIHFESSFSSLGIKYMGNFGQYLVDTFYLIYPAPGNYDNGIFAPYSTGMFYLHWVILYSAYYFMLSWLTGVTDKFFFGVADKKEVIADAETVQD